MYNFYGPILHKKLEINSPHGHISDSLQKYALPRNNDQQMLLINVDRDIWTKEEMERFNDFFKIYENSTCRCNEEELDNPNSMCNHEDNEESFSYEIHQVHLPEQINESFRTTNDSKTFVLDISSDLDLNQDVIDTYGRKRKLKNK